jgi:hypothetical protein
MEVDTFFPLSSASVSWLTDFLAIMVMVGALTRAMRAAPEEVGVRRVGVKVEARATWVFCAGRPQECEIEEHGFQWECRYHAFNASGRRWLEVLIETLKPFKLLNVQGMWIVY